MNGRPFFIFTQRRRDAIVVIRDITIYKRFSRVTCLRVHDVCMCVYLRSTAYAVSGTRLTCFRVTFRMLTDISCFRRRTTRSSTSARRNSQAETYGATTAERTPNSSRPINEEEKRKRLTKSISVIIIVISYGISIRAKTISIGRNTLVGGRNFERRMYFTTAVGSKTGSTTVSAVRYANRRKRMKRKVTRIDVDARSM